MGWFLREERGGALDGASGVRVQPQRLHHPLQVLPDRTPQLGISEDGGGVIRRHHLRIMVGM